MNKTTELAHYVLPEVSYLERDELASGVCYGPLLTLGCSLKGLELFLLILEAGYFVQFLH
ncbi:MAG TPA: hypothetical protein ENN00_00840 [Bacillaceae bacterium]|nr:hypothetical protein [Bacillaceae bacterium]